MDKELKKYMSCYKPWWYVLTTLMSALIVVFIISAIMGNDVKYIGLVIFVAILTASLIPIYLSKKFYEKLENDTNYQTVLDDFQSATPMMKNQVRFGEHYIFIKGKEQLLQYEDIRQVYQYIHKTNFVENERALKYVNQKGKHRKLCNLKLRGNSDEDAKAMVGMIYSKNPSIKIGYR